MAKQISADSNNSRIYCSLFRHRIYCVNYLLTQKIQEKRLDSPAMNEVQNIEKRYQARKQKPAVPSQLRNNFLFTQFCRNEREFVAAQWLQHHIPRLENKKVLEVGAGFGDNLLFLRRCGFGWGNIFANELIPERFKQLGNLLPDQQIFPGDICKIETPLSFDLVILFTVFSSVLDRQLKAQMATKVSQLISPQGHLLWYDFHYDNPKNKDVKGIGFSEVSQLFPDFSWQEKKWVTLAPPIARRVGRLYPLINFTFPFLRTHRMGLLQKRSTS